MSNFISTAQDSLGGGNKAEELEGRSDGENGSLKQREFFWDNIVLFAVSTILGLAAIDVITEFLRGGGVTCFPPLGAAVDEAQAAYINNFCSGFLPVGAYVPAFMVVHAVLITVPHYLWLNHYGGNFDFFFQQASNLQRSPDDQTGKHVPDNLIIVERLESTFTTYRRNSIYHLYFVKLVIQFVWSLVGVAFALAFFLSEFNARFECPPNFNTTSIESWPLGEPVWCVFETLSLLQILWVADVLLLLLVSFGLFWALVWCYTTHTAELGAKEVARFAFESGFSTRYHVPKLPVCNCLHFCFTSIPCLSFSGPNVIKTDLDFLVMRLFLTDRGLGHTFKEVQVEKELKHLADDDQRRLKIHSDKQNNINAEDDSAYYRERDIQVSKLEKQDLRWLFPKTKGQPGIYRDFAMLPLDQQLVVTSSMRGTVLGIGARAPSNTNAISVSFDDSGYAAALARVFQRVAHVNFSSTYNNPDKVMSVNHFYTNVVSLLFAEDVFSSPVEIQNKFKKELRDIWVPPNSRKFLNTGYIVIGPIPREKFFHLTNLDLFLEQIGGCLEAGAVLVSIHPQRIAGKDVSKDFLHFEPSKYNFDCLYQVRPKMAAQEAEWQPRKSQLEKEKAKSGGVGGEGASVGDPQALVPSQQQPLLSPVRDDSKSPPSSPTEGTPGGQSSTSQQGTGAAKPITQYCHPLEVTCAGSDCEVEFSLFKYVGQKSRPGMYNPPERAPVAAALPAGTKVKNVNEKANQ